MAAEDRLFPGGGTATILCVYRNNTTATGVAGGRAQAHNIIDTTATATATAAAAASVVTSRSLCIQGSFPTVFISNTYLYILYSWIFICFEFRFWNGLAFRLLYTTSIHFRTLYYMI